MTKEELKTDESKYIIELVIKDKLRKEAEEWLCNNLHSASEEDFIKAMVDIAESREKRIAELEKENTELKDDNKVMADNYSKMEQKFYDNLTKAKELLERLLITSCNSDVLNLLPNCSEVLRVRVEAEQFLNSEVEK